MAGQRGWLKLEPQGWVLILRAGRAKPRDRIFIGTKADYPSRAQASMARDRYLADLNPHSQRAGEVITVREMAAIYDKDFIKLMKRTSGYSARSVLRKHIVPRLGHLYLPALSVKVLQGFVGHLHELHLARSTIHNILSVLSRMFDWAREYKYQAPKIDWDVIVLPQEGLDSPRRWFTADETVRILAAAEWPWKACYALYAYLGLRTGEGLGLTWQHIDFSADVIKVRQNAVAGHLQTVKSSNSKADMPMPAALKAILLEYRDVWMPNGLDLLFATEHERPWKGSDVRSRFFYPLLKSLSIAHGGFHAFRHGAATLMFDAGVSAPTVKNIMRHGRIDTTLTYTHTVTDDKRVAGDRLAAQFKPSL